MTTPMKVCADHIKYSEGFDLADKVVLSVVITLLWVNSDSQPASVWGDIYDSVGMTDYV